MITLTQVALQRATGCTPNRAGEAFGIRFAKEF